VISRDIQRKIKIIEGVIIRHANPAPQTIDQSFFIREDVELARLLYRHVVLNRSQLLEHLFLLKSRIGATRLIKLTKYGFVNRYEMLNEQNKLCDRFYTISPRSAELLSVPDPVRLSADVIKRLLATNYFILSCLTCQGNIEYELTARSPVSAYIYRDNVYSIYAPRDEASAEETIAHINEKQPTRALIIAPTSELAIQIDKRILVPARYAFDKDIVELTLKFYSVDRGSNLCPAHINLTKPKLKGGVL
jgi:hypothetical protein